MSNLVNEIEKNCRLFCVIPCQYTYIMYYHTSLGVSKMCFVFCFVVQFLLEFKREKKEILSTLMGPCESKLVFFIVTKE